MTIEQQLKDLILQRYGSVLEFTNKTGIAYSTFASILKRGINNATLSNVLKICEALHISADALANGEIQHVDYINPTKKESSCDIADILADTKRQLLSNQALLFNGEPADEESIQSILDAMEVGIAIAKRKTNK